METELPKEDVDYIINILRRGTITWPGRTECLNRGRRKRVIGKKKNGEDKTLWERNCDKCQKWFLLKDNMLEVDHIDPVKGFCGDWNVFIPRMYCRADNLQALCQNCHLQKTAVQSANRMYERKNARAEDGL